MARLWATGDEVRFILRGHLVVIGRAPVPFPVDDAAWIILNVEGLDWEIG